MEIKLLKENYNIEKLYQDFASGNITENADYISNESVHIPSDTNFPIYFAKAHNSFEDFKEAIQVLKKSYIDTDRDIHLSRRFWHSFLTLYKRAYIIEKYPEVLESKKNFTNIVLKKFDWENYIYKCVLAAEYIKDRGFDSEAEEVKFMKVIYSNFDLYNYIIKYNVFRNGNFIINFLTAIDEEGLSDKLKKKIKNRSDLGKDERYGRRVIFEMNKNYPIIMAPFLDKVELKKEIHKFLKMYD
ncbi:hypothetical protein [Brochothrix thermosphacta]|uniref:hypothetical protein n=1 Tax=Brochothrix thermosphacta TaxID=2756 RepID=UPI00265CBB30|nr:hypothetical protein [Brochothrix thermosphacta]WKK69970.1 hypothetical protein Q0G00_05155 [Brochothrix thermosphacta]